MSGVVEILQALMSPAAPAPAAAAPAPAPAQPAQPEAEPEPEEVDEDAILAALAAKYEELDAVRELKRAAANAEAQGGRLLLVSRCLPFSLERTAENWRADAIDSQLDEAVRNLSVVHQQQPNSVWIGSSGATVDPSERPALDKQLRERRYVPVHVDASREACFYEGFCKRVLWPLVHSSPPTTEDTMTTHDVDDDDSWSEADMWNAYVTVNQAFGDAVRDVFRDGDVIWVHGYHLMLLPQTIRSWISEGAVGYFLHVPFPSSELWSILPYREELLYGMLAADLVGFQTYDFARHFFSTVAKILGLESTPKGVELADHFVRVCSCPVGIDPSSYKRLALSEPVTGAVSRATTLSSRVVILGVDQLDPVKGLVHKFLAIERMFARRPSLAEHVTVIQVGQSAHSDRRELQELEATIHAMVARINSQLSSVDFEGPIQYFTSDLPAEELCALFCLADVLLITPIRDGMNIVPFEYVVCREAVGKTATVVLSEFAGCAQSLSGATLVNPWDTEGVVDTLMEAIAQEEADRRRAHDHMVRYVTTFTSQRWSSNFIEQLREATTDPGAGTCRELTAADVLAAWLGGEGSGEEDGDGSGEGSGEGEDAPQDAAATDHPDEPATDHPDEPATDAAADEPPPDGPRLILLSLEGVLSPPAALAELLVVPDDLLRQLETLALEQNTVVVVSSGRSRETLEHLFGATPVVLVAEYGAFIRWRVEDGWESTLPAVLDSSWREDVETVVQYFTERTPGAVLELKESGLAWHYRDCDLDHGAWQAHSLQSTLDHLTQRHPIAVFSGDRRLEVRPLMLHGVTVLQRVLERLDAPAAFVLAVCTGADLDDEDTFELMAPGNDNDLVAPAPALPPPAGLELFSEAQQAWIYEQATHRRSSSGGKFAPRKDFPPTRALFRAMRHAFGRNFALKKPETPAAAWALVQQWLQDTGALGAQQPTQGVELPVSSFSCVVGKKLSQAAYFLKNRAAVHKLMEQLAGRASVEVPY